MTVSSRRHRARKMASSTTKMVSSEPVEEISSRACEGYSGSANEKTASALKGVTASGRQVWEAVAPLLKQCSALTTVPWPRIDDEADDPADLNFTRLLALT
jgi:hypothetical protein